MSRVHEQGEQSCLILASLLWAFFYLPCRFDQILKMTLGILPGDAVSCEAAPRLATVTGHRARGPRSRAAVSGQGDPTGGAPSPTATPVHTTSETGAPRKKYYGILTPSKTSEMKNLLEINGAHDDNARTHFARISLR